MSLPISPNESRTFASKPYASTFYRARGGKKLDAIPRYKFMFYALFVPNIGIRSQFPALDLTKLGTYENGISFKIHNIDKPKVDMNLQELNQYNRKRYVHTKVEYQPFTIKIYDTVDDLPLALWREYFIYYYGDSRPKGQGYYGDTIYNPTIPFDQWGLNPGEAGSTNPVMSKNSSGQYNFFKRIELYAIANGKYTQINYINPKISNIDWSTYDSSSSDLNEVSMTLKYEALEIAEVGTPISEGLANQFGFDFEAAHEPNTAQIFRETGNEQNTFDGPDFNLEANKLKNGRLSQLMDPSQGIASNLATANTTLGIFNGSSINYMADSATMSATEGNYQPIITESDFTYARGASSITTLRGAGNNGLSLSLGFGPNGLTLGGQLMTDAGAISGFVGNGQSGLSVSPSAGAGSLGQLGSFNFGSGTTAGGLGIPGANNSISGLANNYGRTAGLGIGGTIGRGF